MTVYTRDFPIQFQPLASSEAIVTGPAVRFTVLTSRLMRLEYDPSGVFEDRPSQAFWYREQPVPDFQVRRGDAHIRIETQNLSLSYELSDAGFTPETLHIVLKDLGLTWRYGDADPGNLLGTGRTLDEARGAIGLEPGLISRSGWAVVDDSERLIFDENGWLVQRLGAPEAQDLYFFGYGHDYAGCLKDYAGVAGRAPLLPRWVLGNWWSRYWAYSADELLDLMREFRDNKVPLSVCIVDMDWHITDTGNRSSGWTGYTWNRDLFPDPPAFINALHDLGLKTALNLHPALGVFPHEEQYQKMAEWMGLDPASEEPVSFNIADPRFAEAYFELLHHPYEEQGVDFWWIDWQQGTESGVSGLDPLWWLNHLHYYDLGRDGKKRSFIFSRWGGLGNHRYPIGFSGDTVVSWDSLAFQPYFTATAANVGYGWWSHDIGGHMGGVEDAELFTRWIQYGVFSPIFRLHCTKNAYHERRPWGYDAETFRVTGEAMRLRHALIPYLYTMSWRDHTTCVPPVRPMVYDHPAREEAYHCSDQYTFGSELIAAPFVRPADTETRLSRQVVWLPPGEWYQFFDGLSYTGDGWHVLYGGLGDIPVFAKAGAIVPLGPKVGWGGVGNPEMLDVHVFPGASNHFELYEDDDQTAHSLTHFSQTWSPQKLRFEIGAVEGDSHHLPAQREFTLLFRGVANGSVVVKENGKVCKCPVAHDESRGVLTVGPVALAPTDVLTVVITTDADTLVAARDWRLPSCRKLLRACKLDTNVKSLIDYRLDDIVAFPAILADYELLVSENVLRALAETVTGAGAHQITDPADGEQRTVLWNNQTVADVVFEFVARPTVGWSAVRRSGPVPKFAVFKQAGNQIKAVFGAESVREGGVAQWFDNLVTGFRPESASDLDTVVQFDFRGADAYQAYAQISRGTLALVEGLHDSPDLAVEADGKAWMALVNGETSPAELFASGDLFVSGDMDMLMRLANLFAGGAGQSVFDAERWRLQVNFMGMLTLDLGASV